MISSKEMLNPFGPASMVWGRFRCGGGGRPLGRFNWENVPREAIFGRYCEAGISRAKSLA